jgi:superfamily II DNA helicase RecQ/superfamily I DNA/RNA helicase
VLAPQLGWTVAKINERLQDRERRVLVFASPRLRQSVLAQPVDLEISGSLRFLNKRDPVVAAQMRVFAHRYPKEGPFQAYLLPQALLELKARLTSEATEYLICESGLLTKSYRDEVLQLLYEEADVQELVTLDHSISEQFTQALKRALAQRGLDPQVNISDADLHLVLRSIWDTNSFRKFPPIEQGSPLITQKDIVLKVLEKNDQLVVAATGGGKSLCFQLPALLFAEETIPLVTLVFSPLIALMSNQVEHLNRKGIFSAIMLNSTLSPEQRQEHLTGVKKGLYSIIYLAPEQIYSTALRDALLHREIGLVAIDEAHCVSLWGHNFRTDYFMLKKWIRQILCHNQPREFPILALTATARKGYQDPHDQQRSDQASTVTDIIEKLGLRIKVDEVVMSSAIRKELEFHFEAITPAYSCPKCKHHYEYQLAVRTCPHCGFRPHIESRQVEQDVTELKKKRLKEMLGPEPSTSMHLPHLYSRWSRPLGERQRGLIYCAYRKITEEVAAYLKKNIPKIRVSAYHAGMETGERDAILRRFTSDEAEGLDVVVATNAFGMGIDVRRLGFVIHFDTPGTPEAYYQEAGRAGRDSFFGKGKERAACILLFHPGDLEKQRFLSGKNVFSDYEIEDVYQAICEIYKRDREHAGIQTIQPDAVSFSSAASDALHVYASTQELAMQAGVEEERVHTLLYYLEEQTSDISYHRPVLERGAQVSHLWQVQFERGYQKRLETLPEASPSWPLVHAFQQVDEYRLTTDHWTTFSARELADSLHLSLKTLEQELVNLLRRRIIAREGSGYFWLNEPVERLSARLSDLETALKQLLQNVNRRSGGKLERNERVTINLCEVMSQQGIRTFTLPQLTRFLFTYALESSGQLRLLERFHRVIRSGQPEMYELQLWLDRQPGTALQTLHPIIEQLKQTLGVLASRMKDQANYRDWYVIDLFDPDLHFDYGQRRQFHQHLLILQALGFLKYSSDPAMGLVMELTLLQPPVPLDRLEIKLQTLRLQEKHTRRKRKLMEEYATTSSKEAYAGQFAQYFQGAEPLLAYSPNKLRADLTQQQRQIAMLKEGIHVVEGPAGCGKTTVLAEHVKYLVEQQVPLDHILITTHYRSAEGHIAEALKDLDSEGATAVSTSINAFGAKIFKQYCHLLLKPDGAPWYGQAQLSRPLQEAEEEKKEEEAISAALTRLAEHNAAELIRQQRWSWPQELDFPAFRSPYRRNAEAERQFRDAIHRLRWYGIFPTQPPTRDDLIAMLGERTGTFSLAEYYAVYLVFTPIMAERNQYTFDDQIVFALAILRTNPEILHAYQRYFEHIIVDELQDFSPAKVELLLLVSQRHTNIVAFGDVVQEVGFDKVTGRNNGRRAGATLSATDVFAKLAELESCGPNHTHQLHINFRSTQEILDFSTYLRSNAGNGPVMHLCSGPNKHGPKPTYLYTATNEHTNLLVGALDQIERLSPAEKESVALIFGNKAMLHPAQKLLERRNIPFSLMDGEKTLYQVHYVKNALLYLELILDRHWDEEVERLLRYNIVPYLDREQIARLKTLASKHALSLFELIAEPARLQQAKVSKEQQESVQRHVNIITQHCPEDRVSDLK